MSENPNPFYRLAPFVQEFIYKKDGNRYVLRRLKRVTFVFTLRTTC